MNSKYYKEIVQNNFSFANLGGENLSIISEKMDIFAFAEKHTHFREFERQTDGRLIV